MHFYSASAAHFYWKTAQNSVAISQGVAIDPGVHKFQDSAQRMIDATIARLPLLLVAIVVFVFFYFLSILVAKFVRRSTRRRRQNVGIVIARLGGVGTLFLGFLVSLSVVAPSFQASDLIKILGIGGVAIGFAFQNILQNFLAGLLLLWSEPFRVGDEIRLDPFEGTVEEVQARATIVRTYDEKRVVIPNADLFTRSVVVNTALNERRWDYDVTIKNIQNLDRLRDRLVREVESVPGVLDDPTPKMLLIGLSDADVKAKVLWWTHGTRQDEMLASYDQVLLAIRRVLMEVVSEQNENRNFAA
jgi:small conductance mechanosensitive channel